MLVANLKPNEEGSILITSKIKVLFYIPTHLVCFGDGTARGFSDILAPNHLQVIANRVTYAQRLVGSGTVWTVANLTYKELSSHEVTLFWFSEASWQSQSTGKICIALR